jgi:hypothetical protein
MKAKVPKGCKGNFDSLVTDEGGAGRAISRLLPMSRTTLSLRSVAQDLANATPS